ncbi:MAG: restriction endonuclease subunit S, partial [Deltaproteobacteria bacterium]|nr:restriction endonuclease subunit S [Deltaproteobacteria bacterium]
GHRPRTDPVLYDGPYPFVQTGDVATANKYLSTYTQTLSEKGHSISVEFPAGTLLMAIAANIGDLAILGINACLPDSIVGFFPYLGIDVEFLYYQLFCMKSRLHALAPENTQMNLNIDRLSPEKIVVPPYEDQKEICQFINERELQIELTLSAYARQLTLLTEYRAALIHECVTGQRTVIRQTEVESRPTKANVHFLRAVLCSEIIHRLHQEPTFGRVKLEKFLYLSEAYAGIDLEGRYQRAAAGPFDNQALRSVESQIQKQKWYQPVKGEKGTRYVPMEKAGGHQKYFSRYWSEQKPKFDRLFSLLHSFTTERCEIVATLFAVWNDRLRAGQPCNDADIVEEVLTHWHPSNERIPRERWLNALQWMKQEGLTP